jgi:hypothetical protein
MMLRSNLILSGIVDTQPVRLRLSARLANHSTVFFSHKKPARFQPKRTGSLSVFVSESGQKYENKYNITDIRPYPIRYNAHTP